MHKILKLRLCTFGNTSWSWTRTFNFDLRSRYVEPLLKYDFKVPFCTTYSTPSIIHRRYSHFRDFTVCVRREMNVGKSIKMDKTLMRKMSFQGSLKKKHKTVALYITSLAIVVAGGSYAAVPLYRMYCQASGLGGTVKIQDVGDKIESMERQPDRQLTIRFNADTSSSLQWSFKPQQTQVKIVPGETALAFYTAKNQTDNAITGVSTYNVIPFDAGQYFNKIQCFCFEEQRLNPNEEVDMPVFFYIDPEFTEDPAMIKVDTITLSYTFFEAKEGYTPPAPPWQNK